MQTRNGHSQPHKPILTDSDYAWVRAPLLRLLLAHEGEGDAIPQRQLARAFAVETGRRLDKRKIRLAIRRLRKERYNILFSSKGYFMACSREENDRCLRVAASYQWEWRDLFRDMKRNRDRQFGHACQMEMEL